MSLEVLAAGPLTTVQDRGRPGWAHVGVSGSGAADRGALRLANRLVGNAEAAAGLEVTGGGLRLRAGAAVTVAVTGAALPVTVDGSPRPRNAVLELSPGGLLALGTATAGVRAYLAVRGGVDAPAVLGSRSTDTLAGLGPAPLAAGDRLAVGSAVDGWPLVDVAPRADPPTGAVELRALPGPRIGVLGPDGAARLGAAWWRVSADSDRVGVRLEGPPLAAPAMPAQPPSEPATRGAVQLPPSGQPVILLADHPVTGGYPMVAGLLLAETDRAAQLRPGQPVRLVLMAAPELR